MKGTEGEDAFQGVGKAKAACQQKEDQLAWGDMSPKLLRCDVFKILLNQQIKGWVTKKEGSVPISLTTNVGEERNLPIYESTVE